MSLHEKAMWLTSHKTIHVWRQPAHTSGHFTCYVPGWLIYRWWSACALPFTFRRAKWPCIYPARTVVRAAKFCDICREPLHMSDHKFNMTWKAVISIGPTRMNANPRYVSRLARYLSVWFVICITIPIYKLSISPQTIIMSGYTRHMSEMSDIWPTITIYKLCFCPFKTNLGFCMTEVHDICLPCLTYDQPSRHTNCVFDPSKQFWVFTLRKSTTYVCHVGHMSWLDNIYPDFFGLLSFLSRYISGIPDIWPSCTDR